jgi:uncharacterized membrane protein YraQ (UPF0718 family)
MNGDKHKGSNGKKAFRDSFYKTLRSFGAAFPPILGVILLLGLFRVFVTAELISAVFTGAMFRDTVIGALIGSISAGNAIASYIIGGELLKGGVSLFAVVAFIVAWVTVGVVQFPAEAAILGRRFAVARNLLAFMLAMMVSIATVTTVKVIL